MRSSSPSSHDPTEAPPSTVPAPPAPSIVGREREVAVLRAALAAALAGRGSLVLIGGEAGIGKTSLAEAILDEAAGRGAAVLVGRCYDLSETPPYGPWAEAFARASRGGDAPAPPDFSGQGVANQAALYASARDYLVTLAASRPLVLLLDDLHWADQASLDLLRVIARGLADLPLLLLVTYRTDEVTRRHPLYALLPAIEREARATRLDLRPLGEPALRQLVQRYALPAQDAEHLVVWLVERARGNAFFTRQLLRALEDEGALAPAGEGWALGDLERVRLPVALRQVLDARLDRLGEETRHLLTLAAVIGQEAPLALWGVVAETDEDGLLEAIERATEARLLTETPDGSAVRFAHALIREALYENLLATRRRRAHRRVAEALLAGPQPDPDVVAHHLQRAGDPRAAAWLVAAGERARHAYAWLSAADRYEAALALLEAEGGDAGERARLLLTLAQLRRYTNPTQGIHLAEEAERLARAADDWVLAAAARFDHGHLRCICLDIQAGLAEMEEAWPILERLAPAERARLPAPRVLGVALEEDYYRGVLVHWLGAPGRLREALAYAEPFARRAPGTSARGLHGLATASAMLGQPQESRRAFTDARVAYVATGQQREVANLLGLELTFAMRYWGDEPAYLARLADEAERAEALASGMVMGEARGLRGMALLWLTGRWEEARTVAEAASRLSRLDHRWTDARPWLGHILRAQGERERAWRLIHEIMPGNPLEVASTMFLYIVLMSRPLAAALALDEANLPVARAWLDAHDRDLARSGAALGQAEASLAWAAYHHAAGELDMTRRHAEQALAHAMEPRQPLALLAARRLLGELATTGGSYVEAQEHLDAALGLAGACEAPYERALNLVALAELRLATGQREQARDLMEEARPILERLKARPALACADVLAAKMDAAPSTPPSPLVYPAGLSAREVEALRLLARGMTNREIADELSISVKTVNKHVASILGKTGSATRTAAAAFAHRHGLT